jgi:hypothetical protein
MFRSTAWLRGMAVLMLAGFSAQPASAQVCVEDQYGQVVCGRPVDPNRVEPNRGAPRYQDPPPERNYRTPPGRESAAPPARDYRPPSSREFGPPPPERDYGPPPDRESAAPPPRDYAPPPRREYRPTPERDYGPPPNRESAPPPPERDPGREPRNLGRLYQNNEPRYPPPIPGPNGQLSCPRDFSIQDGLCKPYIRR